MPLGYRFGLGAYHLGVRVAGRLGNPRARQWVAGRQQDVAPGIEALHAAGRPIAWFHAASLGEFEQGRPVLELLRRERPELAVVLTFFSPSGYERCADTPLAEVVTYLPEDTPGETAAWVSLLRPALAVFIKYEFWYYHLRTLRKAGVPTVLIAGSFRRSQPFFRWYGGPWRTMLKAYTEFAVQTPHDQALLAELGHRNVSVTGDPRLDRTYALAQTPFHDDRLAAFVEGGAPVLFAGSVWPADVEIILRAWPQLRDRWRLVLAPHQLEAGQLAAWEAAFGADRYTGTDGASRVLLLDTIGLLSRAYRYGTAAFIGGGYGKAGLHNTLEPLSYGLPVLFGPLHQKFPEAGEAVGRGGALVIESSSELVERLNALAEPAPYANAQRAQLSYLDAHRGAARRTVDRLLKLLVCLLLCLPLRAQGWVEADAVTEALSETFAKGNLMVALSGLEWRPQLCLAVTQLEVGQTASIQLTLQVDRRYVFLASAGSDVIDVDLLLRNASGRLVEEDTEPDKTPIVEFTVAVGGKYTVQLQRVAGRDSTAAFIGLAILQSGGESMSERSFRQANGQFGGAAGAVRAAAGAERFRTGNNHWCVYGFQLRQGEGAGVADLDFAAGGHLAIAASQDDTQDLDLYLADAAGGIRKRDRDSDAYPMLSFQLSEGGLREVHLEVARARRVGLVLIGLLEQ